ncbi:SGNH/GDSL hydrolase family protein [Pseudoduganella albidiflava]|uniref:SGNH/GDSL hydrolase family protein n=1 Tax=Pseudoduganella albidiflava TaxID=321983 RepID=A0ABX5RP58_9BURK|nr:SGNH/GDSL hydrolase family protein [Pseudoduganella albidiflava]QBH99642.1 SGNH/GDSL hydrolase family protein [Pseudoduganella albidiflava]
MAHVVLLGDSIFDNGSYVPPGTQVIEQLRRRLGAGHEASLCAQDGSVLADMPAQVGRIGALRKERAPTHLVISCGGNDVLGLVGAMQTPAATVLEAAELLAAWQAGFRRDYRAMLDLVSACGIPYAVSTIYDGVPGLSPGLRGALALFNDVILREAVLRGIPVLDLRLICAMPGDYAASSPIEPSAEGGRKIAAGIAALVSEHQFPAARTVVFAGAA